MGVFQFDLRFNDLWEVWFGSQGFEVVISAPHSRAHQIEVEWAVGWEGVRENYGDIIVQFMAYFVVLVYFFQSLSAQKALLLPGCGHLRM